ncbi:MAG: glycosyltransferase family 9 protein [Planctomycetota bacterium]
MAPALDLPDRVLIVRLGAIGDVANALVVAAALRAHRPAIEIGWAVHELAHPLVAGHPCVDRVHLWRRTEGLTGLRRVLAEIRERRYGLAIDLQRIGKSGLLARLSRAPRTLGFDRRRAKELSWLWHTDTIPPGDPHAHMVEQYMEFVRAVGIEGAVPHHVLPADAAADAWAERTTAGIGGSPVVVCVGASKPPNRWPAERWGELAAALAARAMPPIVLAGGPEDRALFAAALAAASAGGPVHDLVGRTSLRELIALLRRARLFVGGDTGPMHLAGAVGAPVVALFGPADPRRTGPWGRRARVVQHGSRRMEAIGVEEVLAACAELLDSRPVSPGGPNGGAN